MICSIFSPPPPFLHEKSFLSLVLYLAARSPVALVCRCGQARLAASSHSSGEAALGWGSVECENLKLNFKSRNIQSITFSRTRLEKPINGGIFSKECQKGKDMNSLFRDANLTKLVTLKLYYLSVHTQFPASYCLA